MTTEKLIAEIRLLELNYQPSECPSVPMQEITALCDLIENMVPSIDLLEARLERGEILEKRGGKWHLFDKKGESVINGKTLRDVLLNLIWMDC